MILQEKIKQLSKAFFAETVATRRYLHQHPELSFKEVETGKYIAQRLSELGIKHVHGVAENGVVALIEGKNPTSKVIALRADFDALPILEANDVPYKSLNEGVMHACGTMFIQLLCSLSPKF